MKNWFTSLQAAITFSVIALLTEAWRGFLDAMFVLPVDYGGETILNLAALIFTALFAGWTWALIAASRGSRPALVAAFVINALVLVAIPFSWLLVYCPSACRATAGIFNLANTLNLVFGLLAALALVYQLLRPASSRNPKPAGATS
jgi:ammonia channel protein AmtB